MRQILGRKWGTNLKSEDADHTRKYSFAATSNGYADSTCVQPAMSKAAQHYDAWQESLKSQYPPILKPVFLEENCQYNCSRVRKSYCKQGSLHWNSHGTISFSRISGSSGTYSSLSPLLCSWLFCSLNISFILVRLELKENLLFCENQRNVRKKVVWVFE